MTYKRRTLTVLNNLKFASISTRFHHGITTVHGLPQIFNQSITSPTWRFSIGGGTFILRDVPPGGFSLIGKQFVTKSIKYQSILNRISFQLLKAANGGCRRRDIPLPHIFKHLASPHLINMPESFTDLL